MSTRKHPTRWTLIRRSRRLVGRGRSALCRWSGAAAWARALNLGRDDTFGEVIGRSARRASPAAADRLAPDVSTAFVELFPALPAGPAQCTIELCDPSGRKLTISLRGAPGPDLVALTQSLWRAGR